MSRGKGIAIAFGVLVLAIPLVWFGWMVANKGLNNTMGKIVYGWPQMHSGSLAVGDPMPDVTLTRADGESFGLAELGADRPLVLIFGSYT